MGKYDRLGPYLKDRPTEETPMTFAEVEAVIGAPLPPSAKYAAWWSNNPSNNVMTKVWLDAGHKTERVDLGGRKLVFRRSAPRGTSPLRPISSAPPPRSNVLETLRRKLGGSVRMRPGFDPTAPTGEAWDAEA
jgi:hypothetical protein